MEDYQKINLRQYAPEPSSGKRLFRVFLYCIILLCILGYFFINSDQKTQKKGVNSATPTEIHSLQIDTTGLN
jgi:hypothetical protein